MGQFTKIHLWDLIEFQQRQPARMATSNIILLLLPTLVLTQVQLVNMSLVTFDGPQTPFTIYSNNNLNQSFLYVDAKYNCAAPVIYTYQQTQSQYDSNSNYLLMLQSTSEVTLSVSTKYNNFLPSLNQTACTGSCTISVVNNCPASLTNTNYFDIIKLSITGAPTISYQVWCSTSFRPTTFQWGLFLLILLVTLIISVTSLYSKAWSIGGVGLTIGYWFVGALVGVIIIGAILGWLVPGPLNTILDIICTFLGVLCTALCLDEIMWIFRLEFLTRYIVWKVRTMDVIALCGGIGLTLAWWLSDKSWVFTDILSGCMIVALIKLMKITSFKMALALLVSTLSIECIIALIIHYVIGQSYNALLLNNFNNPLMIQLPTVTPVLNQKCAWLPITEVIFPGVFISYLRRFDDSRNTRVYLILSCVAFYLGSMCWMLMTIFNEHSWPYSLFSETVMLLFIAIFATQRNQIRTIWDGKFYDEEFQDKFEVQRLKEDLKKDEGRNLELRESILVDLRVASPPDSSLPRKSLAKESL